MKHLQALKSLHEEIREAFGPDHAMLNSLQTQGSYGEVDDWWATFEWSSGGMVHVHIAFWIVASPRIDKVLISTEETVADAAITLVWDEDASVVLNDDAAARVLTKFYDRVYTEWNPFKNKQEEVPAVGVRRSMGKKIEKTKAAIDMISTASIIALLETDASKPFPAECWYECVAIFKGSCPEVVEFPAEPPTDKQELFVWTCRMRHLFVGLLATWVQMHDYHEPFASGPPSKSQACAKTEHEHSSLERTECGKLFPRKVVDAGAGEILEDPRRRELYRLWLGRNCSFINNYVPVMMLATNSNMDWQATTTKFGVIEYMTKYMTKSGQGSLLSVMEHSFAKCMEKAIEEEKGFKSAAAKFFNLAAIQDVKSQLETMHLCFQLPRFLCSRSFRRLATRSEVRKIMRGNDVTEQSCAKGSCTFESALEVYISRCQLQAPKAKTMMSKHPVSQLPLAEHIRRTMHHEVVQDTMVVAFKLWPEFIQLQSWWEYTKCFTRERNVIELKRNVDVIIVSPMPRLAKVGATSEYSISCRNALLAFCNFGPTSSTFKTVQELEEMCEETVVDLLAFFVKASPEERSLRGMCVCPVFLKRSWVLGQVRLAKLEKKIVPQDTVQKIVKATHKKTVDIFKMENKAWRSLAVSDMSKEDYGRAKEAWNMGQIAFEEKRQNLSEDKKTILHNMMSYMQEHLKWKIEHLHDACLCVGCCPPSEVNMMSYFDRLHHQCGNAKVAFQPQNKKSHVKTAFVKAIKTLQEGGRNMGGVTGSKLVLAERLASILNCVIQAGSEGKEREKLQEEIENEDYVDFATSSNISALRKHVHLAPLPSKPGAIPQQANIDAAMAESSLGWNINDEIDDEVQETVDADIRAEEESIRGVNVNPPGFNYECLAPDATLLSFAEANVIGLTDASIQFDRDLFGGSEHQFQEHMMASIAEQKQRFRSTANKEFALQQHAERVAALDPTQFRVYQSIQTWSNQCATLPPLRLLVLGTAGTGKTFTLKCAVEAARMAWNSFESVLLTAHTGVAAVNMGGGAATINSIFKMGGNNADVDLDGDKLEELVEELSETKLVIIDEISTVGAAQFEMVSRTHLFLHLHIL